MGVDPFIEGQEVIVFTEFKQFDDVARRFSPADPGIVTIRVRKPDGTTVVKVTPDPDISNPTVGRFELALIGDVVGTWRTRSEGEFAPGQVAVDEGSFAVRASRL